MPKKQQTNRVNLGATINLSLIVPPGRNHGEELETRLSLVGAGLTRGTFLDGFLLTVSVEPFRDTQEFTSVRVGIGEQRPHKTILRSLSKARKLNPGVRVR
jgi:hypothetical protein